GIGIGPHHNFGKIPPGKRGGGGGIPDIDIVNNLQGTLNATAGTASRHVKTKRIIRPYTTFNKLPRFRPGQVIP
ncbi:unnamed protein product, partial [Larinioides sclopetarius]